MDSLPTFDDDDEQAFLDSVLNDPNGHFVINHTYTYAKILMDAEKELVKLSKDESITLNRYRDIFHLIRHERVIKHYFPLSRFSPYVTICFSAGNPYRDNIADQLDTNEEKQELLEKLRQALRSDSFRKTIERKKKAISKNKQSLLKYIKALFEYRSRLLVVRLDLGYSNYSKLERLYKFRPHHTSKKTKLAPMPTPQKNNKIFGEIARQHRDTLIKQLSTKFKKDLVGYVWKLEYGKDKGLHYHMIFFLDGSTCREDITIAKAIGELWKTEITHSEGVYWNLNADKKRFEINNRVATGMIHYKDITMRNNLVRMATYLIKPDYFVRTVLPDGARTFGKGGLPAKTKTGRPRNLI